MGCGASILKATGEVRGWPHRRHNELGIIADSLAQEIGDEDLRRGFDTASSLHVNFYENWVRRENVEGRIRDVERFVDMVCALLPEEPPYWNDEGG